MPRVKIFSLLLCCAIGSGCYQYSAPDPAMTGMVYSPGNYAKSQKILDENHILTLERAVQIALANNPTLTSALQSANAARFNYYSSIGAYAPDIEISAGVQNKPAKYGKLLHPIPETSRYERHFLFDVSADMSYLIFDGLAREFKVLAARKTAESKDELTKDAARKLIYAVAVAYYDVLLAVESENIYRSDMEFQNVNLEFCLKQQRAGYSDLAQVLNFRILKARAHSSLRTWQYQKQVSMLSLAMLLGYPDGTLPRPVEFPAAPNAIRRYKYPLENCLELAISRRPDYRASMSAMQSVEYMKFTKYSAYFPTVNFVAGASYQTDHAHYDTPPLPRDSDVYGGVFYYGIEASWKFFDGLSRYNTMREYQAMYAALQYNMAEMYLKIVNEVRSAYADYENNFDQCLIYREMLEWVATQRQLVEVEYRSGRVIVTRLNEAQNDLVTAQSDYLISLVNLYKSGARLDAAIYEQQ